MNKIMCHVHYSHLTLRHYLITIIDAEPVYTAEMSYLQAAAPTRLIRDIKCHRSLETVITIRLNCTKINH